MSKRLLYSSAYLDDSGDECLLGLQRSMSSKVGSKPAACIEARYRSTRVGSSGFRDCDGVSLSTSRPAFVSPGALGGFRVVAFASALLGPADSVSVC